jgi:hypothetical protein
MMNRGEIFDAKTLILLQQLASEIARATKT